MQLTLIAGGYYFLEQPDLCRSCNISGVSTWTSEATERIKIAIAPWCSVSFRKASSEPSRGYLELRVITSSQLARSCRKSCGKWAH